MSTVWEDTSGCDKQYRCALTIYLVTMLLSKHGIIMDFAINPPGHGNNVVDGLNATEKLYLKEQMELIGKWSSKDTSNIGMIPSASKDVSIKFVYQCIHITNNKETLNGLKVIIKIQKR